MSSTKYILGVSSMINTYKKILVILLGMMVLISGSLSAKENLHKWADHEIATLKDLWIETLPNKPTNPKFKLAFNEQAAELGHRIFFDKRFSANRNVSCASCHKPEFKFTDSLTTAEGIGITKRNTPTLVGIAYSDWFFLDGRADSLWLQAMGPMEDALEHGGNRNQFAHIIYNDPELKSQYEKIFGKLPDLKNKKRFPRLAGPVKNKKIHKAWLRMREDDRQAITEVFANIGKAIAAYEIKLKPGPSQVDNYIKAVVNKDKKAIRNTLSEIEVKGLRLFISKANCIICHNGPMLTDFGFHNVATPPADVKRYDFGRWKGANAIRTNKMNCYSGLNDDPRKNCDEIKYIVYHKEHTLGSFKTPTLRNISQTGPYMHAGQYTSVMDVIKHYNDPPTTKIGQSDLRAIPIQLNKDELLQLEAFLLALDSEIAADRRWLSAPK